jgi:hypothetical protein
MPSIRRFYVTGIGLKYRPKLCHKAISRCWSRLALTPQVASWRSPQAAPRLQPAPISIHKPIERALLSVEVVGSDVDDAVDCDGHWIYRTWPAHSGLLRPQAEVQPGGGSRWARGHTISLGPGRLFARSGYLMVDRYHPPLSSRSATRFLQMRNRIQAPWR